ncbi:MAG: apolipoprotein N-acyltransferase [Bacteroidia bacterium]|nr:apolipoprotein N-acyltransferase [Bacteroidia bacterium]
MNRFRLIVLSLFSGALLSLAWTEWCPGIVLLFAMVPLLLVEDYIWENRNNIRSVYSFLFAYLTFFTWNIISTWWIVKATWVGASAAFVFNSLFMAVVFWMFHLVKRSFGKTIGYIALVTFWIAFEYLHLNWDLSWTWLNLGNGFAKNNSLIQWYEFTGILGGSFWIICTNILATSIIIGYVKEKSLISFRYKLISLGLLIVIPVVFSLFTYYSYSEKKDPRNIVVLQPNIDPYNEKFNGLSDNEQLDILLKLAKDNADSTTDFIVAPETALPSVLWEPEIPYSNSFRVIQQSFKFYPRARFVMGLSSGKVFKKNEKLTPAARKFTNENLFYELYNTALQTESSGNIQFYHKSKLVLGVEKMPFRSILSFLDKFSVNLGGTTGSLGTQEERTVFISKTDISKVGVLICYESIFGEFTGKYIKNGANLLFVITNDGWWGDSPGYKQHLHFSQLRAVENRRSVARSANTGISCFINQRGDIIKPTFWWTRTAIKSSINANDKMTFYSCYGDYLGIITAASSCIILIFLLFYRIRKHIV